MICSLGFLCGVDVEICFLFEVIGGIVGNVFVVSVVIGCDDGNVMFGCVVLDGGFGDEVLFGVGEVWKLV